MDADEDTEAEADRTRANQRLGRIRNAITARNTDTRSRSARRKGETEKVKILVSVEVENNLQHYRGRMRESIDVSALILVASDQ